MSKIKDYIEQGKNIIDGWKNFYFRKVTIEEIADVRRAICQLNKCNEYRTTGVLGIHCGVCGCPIEKKVRSLHTACPKELWGKTDELQLLITHTLFERSGFIVDRVSVNTSYYRHKKYVDIVISFNSSTGVCANGVAKFELWKDVQDYFKSKTGNDLN